MNDDLLYGGDDFLARVEVCYDAESIIDILDLSILDMIEAFGDKILENKELFQACYTQYYVDMEGENDGLV